MAENTEQVRTLTGLDTDELTDDNIAALLQATGDVVTLAAAAALEVVAGQLVDATDPEGLSVQGSKRAAVLMARAQRLREQHAADQADADDGFFFDVVGGARRGGELTETEVWRW